jgi:hypothetical protein
MSVVGKFDNDIEHLVYAIELYFKNLNNSGVRSYVQFKKLDNFLYFIRFDNYDSVKAFLKCENVILENKFILEEYINFNL